MRPRPVFIGVLRERAMNVKLLAVGRPEIVEFGEYVVTSLDTLHDHLRVCLHLDRGPCGYQCRYLLPLASSAGRSEWRGHAWRRCGNRMQKKVSHSLSPVGVLRNKAMIQTITFIYSQLLQTLEECATLRICPSTRLARTDAGL
jgi:hypothetical protein